MKTSWIDYLLSTLAITLLVLLGGCAVYLIKPLTYRVLGAYHVLADLAIFMLLFGLLAAILVRALLAFRPMRPGRYSADSHVFTYWKLLTIVYRMGQGALKPFAPVFLQPVIDALFGARMGKDVALGGTIDDPYMVSVGDGTALGTASIVSGSYMAGGEFICGTIVIGRDVTVGPNSVVLPDTEIGDGASLMIGSCLMPGSRVPPGETWRGNPARKWVGSRAQATDAGS